MRAAAAPVGRGEVLSGRSRAAAKFDDDTRLALHLSLLVCAPAPPSSASSASDGFVPFFDGDDDDDEAGPAPPPPPPAGGLVPQQRRGRGRPVGSGLTGDLRRPTATDKWWSISEEKFAGAARKEQYRYSAVGKAQ
ncbi:hypothetical protein LTR85_009068 [Meristemomyces frigidus]|nr:hypothetical protein LTR85_009068 [Meristemomyces frigidus]